MMSLKCLRVKTLKILLNSVGCPAHVKCGVLAYFLATFYNILQNLYMPVGAFDSFLRSCCICVLVVGRKLLDYRTLHQLLENTKWNETRRTV